MRLIPAKTIISTVKGGPDPWFGFYYNMNLYRGCQHACIYCDSRSACYQLGELSDIRLKDHALLLLENELKGKRKRGTVGFGSMNDPYMPEEARQQATRGALELCAKYHFPIHIITKGDLVVRDIDLLQKISKVYAAISITITTTDDELSRVIEPAAPVSSRRFAAIRQLSQAGIYTGVTLMPVLPYLTDSPENIRSLVYQAKDNGAQYIIAAMGLTMRDGQREYFYQKLDQHFPGLSSQYHQSYGERYSCDSPRAQQLWAVFTEACQQLDMPMKIKVWTPPPSPLQLDLF